jgi:D-sedoheptulose 7-phosphate isomerase
VAGQLEPIPVVNQRLGSPGEERFDIITRLEEAPAALAVLRQGLERSPALHAVEEALGQAFGVLWRCFRSGGTLFLAGNGGSMADALHISGELLKSFKRPRPAPEAHRARLAALPGGEALAAHLQQGMRALVLGANLSLRSAVDNDVPLPNMALAQELYALGRPGDVLLGISTSGNAQNVLYAATVARALGVTVIGLTGARGGKLAEAADVAIRVPATETDAAQTLHQQVYHVLCDMLEAQLF